MVGTGFRTYQESEVRVRPEALEALAAQKDRILSRTFPLLDGVEDENGSGGDGAAKEAAPAVKSAPESLDALLGGSQSDAGESNPPAPSG